MAQKKCPRCAEIVQDEARACRHCGHKFGPFIARNILMGLATAGLVLYLAGKGESDSSTAEAPTTALEAQNASGTPVTIAELYKAYDENEARAQSEYGNQMLIVQGEVTDIDLGLTDDPIVTLSDDRQTINTYFDKDRGGKGTVDLKRGEHAAIACNRIRETMGSPSLHDCFVGDVSTIKPADPTT